MIAGSTAQTSSNGCRACVDPHDCAHCRSHVLLLEGHLVAGPKVLARGLGHARLVTCGMLFEAAAFSYRATITFLIFLVSSCL